MVGSGGMGAEVDACCPSKRIDMVMTDLVERHVGTRFTVVLPPQTTCTQD